MSPDLADALSETADLIDCALAVSHMMVVASAACDVDPEIMGRTLARLLELARVASERAGEAFAAERKRT